MPNDWNIGKVLRVIVAVSVAAIGLAALHTLGTGIPVFQQVSGFLFLTFVPGLLLLRVLRIHDVEPVEVLAYSVGLSVSVVMFGGALLNFILRPVGVQEPVSLPPLLVAAGGLTALLAALAWWRDRGHVPRASSVPKQEVQLPPLLFLVLLLVLTMLGVALVDAYRDNALLLASLLMIAAMVGLAAFGKFLSPASYAPAVFIISLCLLYQTTLMSPYPVGTDIYDEYHFFRLAAESGYWDASIRSTVNSCLSITILAPVYSMFLGVDGTWVFKAVYPLLFSLMPVVLFHVFRQQMTAKKAFLATFFLMAVPTFSLEMVSLCRQQIAELFFALFILILVDRRLPPGRKLVLGAVFAPSIVVSHYSLGFIGFIYLGLFIPLVVMLRADLLAKGWHFIRKEQSTLRGYLKARGALPVRLLAVLVVVYFAAGFAWYGLVASGVNLQLLSRLWGSQTATVTQTSEEPRAFFDLRQRDPLVQTAVGLDFLQVSPQGKTFRVLQYATQLFLVIGAAILVFRLRRLKFTPEFLALSLVSIMLILACVLLPGFAESLNTSRWYHIALLTVAPLFVIGGESVWRLLRKPGRALQAGKGVLPGPPNQTPASCLGLVAAAVLVPYFLFTSGLVYEVSGQEVTDEIDTPYSIALTQHRLDLTATFYRQDGAAAQWLSENGATSVPTYTDSHTAKILMYYQSQGDSIFFPRGANPTELRKDTYIYLGETNLENRQLTFGTGPGLRTHIPFEQVPSLISALAARPRIYDNGAAQVLGPQH
ncbi:MAG: DUF2206 domain-containing protein [Chloroflexota bacterium]